jgi:hypothetical protein
MKRPLAAVAAAIAMAGMLWLGLLRSGSPSAVPPPSSAGEGSAGGQSSADFEGAARHIEGLLADVERGDVDAYLAAFSGSIRDRLTHQVEERGRPTFGEDLRRTARVRKSHAVFEPEPDGGGPDKARIAVESTFADRIERQTFRLVRVASGWVITDVETARDHLPRNALGSAANYEAPEGPPVPVPVSAATGTDESIQEP